MNRTWISEGRHIDLGVDQVILLETTLCFSQIIYSFIYSSSQITSRSLLGITSARHHAELKDKCYPDSPLAKHTGQFGSIQIKV